MARFQPSQTRRNKGYEIMLLASPNHLARSPPVSQNLTHVNNPGIIANASAADLRKLFTEPRNRLFTSSESARVVPYARKCQRRRGEITHLPENAYANLPPCHRPVVARLVRPLRQCHSGHRPAPDTSLRSPCHNPGWSRIEFPVSDTLRGNSRADGPFGIGRSE